VKYLEELDRIKSERTSLFLGVTAFIEKAFHKISEAETDLLFEISVINSFLVASGSSVKLSTLKSRRFSMGYSQLKLGALNIKDFKGLQREKRSITSSLNLADTNEIAASWIADRITGLYFRYW
jgi:hypothetical protein